MGFGLKATSSFSAVTQKHTRTHSVLFTSSWLFFTLQTRAIHHQEKKKKRKMEKSQSGENGGAWERSRHRKQGERRGKDKTTFLITSAAQ